MAPRVIVDSAVAPASQDNGVVEHVLVPPVAGSELSLSVLRLEPEAQIALGAEEHDTLLYAFDGSGDVDGVDLAGEHAALVAAGETAVVRAGGDGLSVVRARVTLGCDEHAPLGEPVRAVALDDADDDAATGSRAFRILYGPHNGCTRATLFIGYVPPGRAPWHFHLYDEIVWVCEGSARFHHAGGVEDAERGAAFRIRPREVHIVENLGDENLVLLGLFTPAGSPSAAYLAADPTAQ